MFAYFLPVLFAHHISVDAHHADHVTTVDFHPAAHATSVDVHNADIGKSLADHAIGVDSHHADHDMCNWLPLLFGSK